MQTSLADDFVSNSTFISLSSTAASEVIIHKLIHSTINTQGSWLLLKICNTNTTTKTCTCVQVLINSLMCWFCMSALGLVPFQIFNIFQTCKLLRTVTWLLCGVSLREYELFYIPPEDKKNSTFQQMLWTKYGDNEHHLISHKLKTKCKKQ